MQSQGTFGGKEFSIDHLGPSSSKSTGTKKDIENAKDGQRTGIVHEMRDDSVYLYNGDITTKLSQETFYNYQEEWSRK